MKSLKSLNRKTTDSSITVLKIFYFYWIINNIIRQNSLTNHFL